MHFLIDFSTYQGAALEHKYFPWGFRTEVFEMDVGLRGGPFHCPLDRNAKLTIYSYPATGPLAFNVHVHKTHPHHELFLPPKDRVDRFNSRNFTPGQKSILTSFFLSFQPRHIHDIPSPSLILSPALDTSFAGTSSNHLNDASETNVCYTGYMSIVSGTYRFRE